MDINKMLEYLNKILPPNSIIEHENHYTMPTICHNQAPENASNKLYLYKNESTKPLFHCFTECGETFNIYTLIQKIHELNGKSISFGQAYKIFHGESFRKEKQQQPVLLNEYTNYQKDFNNPLEVVLHEYPSSVLDLFNFSNMSTHPWVLEGVDEEIILNYLTPYSKSMNGVIIPHFDWQGRLVGIRIRNFDPFKEKDFKYMPLQAQNIFYRHPLGNNLYGIYENQEQIKKYKTVYLFEGEKSVLQASHMFKHDLSLAVCGSKISEWQAKMLVHYLGVEKVYVCFDKEYQTYSEMYDYIEKINKQTTYIQNFADVIVAIDDKNSFKLKESPVDRTKKDFELMTFRQVGV